MLWTKEEFEKWLYTKDWSEEIKNIHRENFRGYILFRQGKIIYEP